MARKRNNNGIIYVVISLVLVVGLIGIVNAGQSFKQLLANAIALLVVPKIEASLGLDEPEQPVEPELGAFPGPDIYQQVNFYDGMDIEKSEEGFTKRIKLPTATTTEAGGATPREMTSRYLMNTWGNSFCDRVTLVQLDENDYIPIIFEVGTATPSTTAPWAVTSTPSLIAQTEIATNTQRTLSSNDHPGTAGYATVNAATVDYLKYFDWNLSDAIGVQATSVANYVSGYYASSTGYLDNSGFVDVHCWLKTTKTSEFTR